MADPKIANAVIRSARRAYMIGVEVGQTNIYFFDAAGKQIAGFDIAVNRDLNGVRAALKRALPDANIQIEGVGDGVMLTGTASSPAEAQQAYDIAARLVGDGTKVVNGITVRGRDQVMLKVTVAEVQRDVVKQLGIDLNGSLGYGTGRAISTPTIRSPPTGQPLAELVRRQRAIERAASNDQRDAARDGARRRHPHAGRAQPDARSPAKQRTSWPAANFRSRRANLRHQLAADLPAADRLQEIRRQPDVHAGGAVGRPHQPQGDDGSVRPVHR